MIKNKTRLLILLFTVLALICTFSFATDDGTAPTDTSDQGTESAEQATTEGAEGQNASTTSLPQTNDNLQSGDVYKTGQDVKIDNLVDGNVFATGTNVTVTGQIGGDLFVIADSLTIDNGYVYGNIFVLAKNITINGVIYDLYSVCENLNIQSNGLVYRDLRTYASNVVIDGIVGRNANISTNTISVAPTNKNACIYGNLDYSAKEEIEIPAENIKGEAHYTAPKPVQNVKSIASYLVSLVSTLAYTIIVCLTLSWLTPKFTEKAKNIVPGKLLPAIGLGFVALILIPIVGIILAITYIGVPLALTLFALYAFILSLCFSITSMATASFVQKKFNWPEKNMAWYILAIAIILWLLKQIPVAGGIIGFLIILIGLGTLVLNMSNKEGKASKTKKVVANE